VKIVVAVDMSEVTDSMIREAIAVARAMDAEIEIVHVLQSIPEAMILNETFSVLPYTYAREDIEEDRRKILKKMQSAFAQEDISSDIILLDGDPADQILSQTEKTGADWIVIGSHGHGALYHLVLGSVSEKVIDRAPCPVLVVKKEDTEQD
jgi:nucleotide-binding universal stress UspA family protein